MARDVIRYCWRQIGIPYGEVLEALEQEAKAFHETLPTYIRMLLVDRHEALKGNGQGRWFPRGTQVLPQQSITSPALPLQKEEKVLANARKAATFVDNWDEDDEPTVPMQAMRGA